MNQKRNLPIKGIREGNVQLFRRLIDASRDASTPCMQDPETWWSNDPGDIAVAKRLCDTCPVRELCLTFAKANREVGGVWGGVSSRQRLRHTGGE